MFTLDSRTECHRKGQRRIGVGEVVVSLGVGFFLSSPPETPNRKNQEGYWYI